MLPSNKYVAASLSDDKSSLTVTLDKSPLQNPMLTLYIHLIYVYAYIQPIECKCREHMALHTKALGLGKKRELTVGKDNRSGSKVMINVFIGHFTVIWSLLKSVGLHLWQVNSATVAATPSSCHPINNTEIWWSFVGPSRRAPTESSQLWAIPVNP